MSFATFVHPLLRIWRSGSPSLASPHTLLYALCAGGLACIVLVTQGYAANVTLTWDASGSSDVRGYRLYHGPASGIYTTMIDVGNQTTYDVTDVLAGQTYYFAATAYNQEAESEFSNEVRYTTPPARGGDSPPNDPAPKVPGPDNAGTPGTPIPGNTPPAAVNNTAALTISLGEQTPTMDTLLTVSTHTEFLPVLQVRVDTGAEEVSLTEVTVTVSPSLDERLFLDNVEVQLLYDANGNGQVDAIEPALALAPIGDTSQSLTLTFTMPLDLAPQTTTYLLVTLAGDSPGVGTHTATPTRTGWLLLTPLVFGMMLFPWRRHSSTWRGLGVLLLVCSVAFVSCQNGHDGENGHNAGEATVTLTLPAHSVRAEGTLSGPLSGPTASLVSPPIVVEQP